MTVNCAELLYLVCLLSELNNQIHEQIRRLSYRQIPVSEMECKNWQVIRGEK